MPSRHTQSARPISRSRRPPKCAPAVWLAAIALAVLTACDTPGVTLVDPDLLGGEGRGLTVTVHLEDTTLARALGWSQGVPGAGVFLMRVGDDFDPITLLTDSTGTAYLETALPGQYRMAAHRVLSQAETGPTGGIVRAFGDGRITHVTSGASISLTLLADQPSPVVFSEIQLLGQYEEGRAPLYNWFQYFELYNNADTTIYLDGMLWGRTWQADRDFTPYPCAVTEPFRNDPAGLWANYIHRFPGTGSDYPLVPGQAVVVALDAVDHSMVHPKLPDLTTADFELEGRADADNPDVPNLPEVGPDPFIHDHGVEPHTDAPLFLALPLDLGALVQQKDPFWGHPWVRIPMEAVLDVVEFDPMLPVFDVTIARPCAGSVPRRLHRLQKAMLGWQDATLTAQRKVLRTVDGRFVLQDVNTSFVDLAEAKRNPGTISN